MNKTKGCLIANFATVPWISVYPGEEISEALLRDLINDSWNLVVDGLAKRDQKRVRPG
ncbi:hypothetical protein KU15F73_45750 [Escherichia coli]|nr:hypothetical protein [Escherichia coli]NWG69950.1 hypothetical protein [Escherichia coli]HBE5483801.1 hypothetical protein [Escherichia coli]